MGYPGSNLPLDGGLSYEPQAVHETLYTIQWLHAGALMQFAHPAPEIPAFVHKGSCTCLSIRFMYWFGGARATVCCCPGFHARRKIFLGFEDIVDLSGTIGVS
eukprot:scaffold213452_cov15-Tisochrysis_lutea.AAC.1